MKAYRLIVEQHGKAKPISQGTAWFLRSDLVATAFHVVSDENSHRWYHDLEPQSFEYKLSLDDSHENDPLLLQPDVASHRSDIALLRVPSPVPKVTVLEVAGTSGTEQQVWESEAYPSMRLDQRFALTGNIAKLWSGNSRPNEAVQLRVDQGTYKPDQADDRPLAGISGAPVIGDARVIGLITRVTDNMDTAHAADASSIREVELASRCAEIIAGRYQDTKRLDVLVRAAGVSLYPVDERTRQTPAAQLLEACLRSDTEKLRLLVDLIGRDYPDDREVAELYSSLRSIEPWPEAVAKAIEKWTKPELKTLLEDVKYASNFVYFLENRTQIEDRFVLVVALKVFASLVTCRGRANLSPGGNRRLDTALRILAFHFRKLLPALDLSAAILSSERGGAENLVPIDQLTESLETTIGRLSGADGQKIAAQLIAQIAPTRRPRVEIPLLQAADENRFSYAARATVFVGRAAENRRLAEFLDGERRFTWWLMVGPTGSGKSRLALEFCLQHAVGWNTGFLDSSFNDWDSWQPIQPTLLVADDASIRAEALNEITNNLRKRVDLQVPVRLLLLERYSRDTGATSQFWEETGYKTFVAKPTKEAMPLSEVLVGTYSYNIRSTGQFSEETWYDRFVGKAIDREKLEEVKHGPDLQLQKMSDAEILELMESVANSNLPTLDGSGVLERLFTIDPRGRPLFASFFADALSRQHDPRRWDPTALIKSVLEHEEERWEEQQIPGNYKDLLAFATMIDGMLLKDLATCALPRLLPDSQTFDPSYYRSLSGSPAQIKLAPLTPDILGEMFVLQRVRQRHQLDNRAALLSQLAWKRAPSAISAFLEHAMRDFPRHSSLLLLIGQRPETQEASIQWSITAANMTYYVEAAVAAKIYEELCATAARFPNERALRERQARAAANLLAIQHEDLSVAEGTFKDLAELWKLHGDETGLLPYYTTGVFNMILNYRQSGPEYLPRAKHLFEQLSMTTKAYRHPELLETLGRAAYDLSSGYSENHDFYAALAMNKNLGRLAEDNPRVSMLRGLQAKSALNIAIEASIPGVEREMGDTLNKLTLKHPDETVLREQQALYQAHLIIKVCGGAKNYQFVPDQPRLKTARSHYNVAVGILGDRPILSSSAEALGHAAGNLLECFRRAGRTKLASEMFHNVITPLASDHPDNSELIRLQARAANGLMVCFETGGKLKQAEKIYGQFVARIAADHPEDPYLHKVQAVAINNLASLYEENGQAVKAQKLRSVLSERSISLGGNLGGGNFGGGNIQG